ncbi:MAG: uncharacterized protein JWM53_2264 [bacterium]|nr:uncharacterized protein [bacterium]
MHIGIVGGLDRAEPLLLRIAAAAGHTVEFHNGRTNARGTAQLDALIERSQLVLVLTDINSHGGVQLARRLAARRGRPLVILRRLGAARFAELCAGVTLEEAAARPT